MAATSDEASSLLPKTTLPEPADDDNESSLPAYGTISAAEDGITNPTKTIETSWKAESKILTRYSAPLIVTYMLQYSYVFVTMMVAGRLGTNELAAASLASTTAEVTGLAVYEGLATSLDTLTSQAFGAGKKQLVGLQVQRMVALSLVVTIPIGAVWLSSPWILAKLVPEKDVAYLAGDFLRFYLIAAPGYGIFEAVKRFTQCQGDFTGPFVTTLLCAPLNVFWNWLIVFVSGSNPLYTVMLTRKETRSRLSRRSYCCGYNKHFSALSVPPLRSLFCPQGASVLGRHSASRSIHELGPNGSPGNSWRGHGSV